MSERGECIHTVFERVAAAQPDRVALTCDAGRMSYEELDGRANQLAQGAIARGLRPGGHVALLIERSMDMVVAMLACLKAGAAYVPLDPGYPASRLEFMLTDSEPSHIFAQRSLVERLPAGGAAVICVDDPDRKSVV